MNLSQANILVEQALDAYQNKRFADAEELWAAAGKLCAEGGQWICVASWRLNRGNALANLGRFAEAIAEFDLAEPVFDQFQSEIGAAGCRISRGDAMANRSCVGAYQGCGSSSTLSPSCHFLRSHSLPYD